MRSAYLHMVGDVLGSVAVLLAAGIMYFTHWYMADPLLSILFGLVILYSAFQVGQEALHILMEGVPAGMSLPEIAASLEALPGVISVHHVHAWSICSNILAGSVHVVGNYTSEQERMELKLRVQALLEEKYGLSQTTIETECGDACPLDNGLVHPFTHEEG